MSVLPDFAGKRFCFAGNRAYVLDEMLAAGLDVVAIFAVRDSFLARELDARGAAFELIDSRDSLVACLEALDFDYFVSNGLPLLLPIGRLKADGRKRFINIHPSCLPDLRGRDPVPGALLHGRSSGASCHEMDDSIDGGPLIEKLEIPYSADLDCGLLYQLSFHAEREVFKRALAAGLKRGDPQRLSGDEIYYSLKEADKRIDFGQSAAEIVRQVRAFNTRSQGAFFLFAGERVVAADAEVVQNPYVLAMAAGAADGEVLLRYEDQLLVKTSGACLKLKPRSALPASLRVGCQLAPHRRSPSPS